MMLEETYYLERGRPNARDRRIIRITMRRPKAWGRGYSRQGTWDIDGIPAGGFQILPLWMLDAEDPRHHRS